MVRVVAAPSFVEPHEGEAEPLEGDGRPEAHDDERQAVDAVFGGRQQPGQDRGRRDGQDTGQQSGRPDKVFRCAASLGVLYTGASTASIKVPVRGVFAGLKRWSDGGRRCPAGTWFRPASQAAGMLASMLPCRLCEALTPVMRNFMGAGALAAGDTDIGSTMTQGSVRWRWCCSGQIREPRSGCVAMLVRRLPYVVILGFCFASVLWSDYSSIHFVAASR